MFQYTVLKVCFYKLVTFTSHLRSSQNGPATHFWTATHQLGTTAVNGTMHVAVNGCLELVCSVKLGQSYNLHHQMELTWLLWRCSGVITCRGGVVNGP